MIFLGFTGASSVGLLIGQRILLANDQQSASQSIALRDKAIHGLQNELVRLESAAPTIIQLQHRHEGLLGHIHLAHSLHPLLALSLLLQQFFLP